MIGRLRIPGRASAQAAATFARAAATCTVAGAILATGAADASAQLRLQLPADAITHPRGDVFIQGLDRVYTASGEVLENTSILIQGGIIRALGPDLEAPAGVRVVNGSGRTAIPGIVDEHSHTAMIGTNEGSAPIVPEITVLDALNHRDYGIFRALSGGITTARLMHGSSNPIGGQSAVIKMRWGMDEATQMLVPGAPRAVKFALGENVTRKASQGGGGFGQATQVRRFPASRQGVEALYVQAFTAAEAYRQVWRDYETNPSAFRGPPRRDLRLQALVDIMEDRILVHAHSYTNDEILMLMRVAERFGFTIDAFTHILEGYRVAEELVAHGAAASTFSDWWQYKLEAYDAIPHNASLMAEKGVLTAINSDISWLQTYMNWEIAKPVQYGGASREEALRMLTLNPARILGIDAMVGSLEVGKHGDVVLLTGDPFDSFSRVEKTFIEGVLYFDSEDEAGTRGEVFNALPSQASTRYVAGAGDRPGGAAAAGVGRPDVSGSAPEGLEPVNTRAEAVALVGGTIHPITGTPIENGVILLEGGYIQAMGPRGSVTIPAGVRQVDVTGRHLYPGMIDPVTYLGIFEIGSIPQATDRSETGRFNPHVRALGAYQPHGRAPFVARARGITAVLTAQSGGVIEGMGSVVNLEGDTFERAEIRGEGALMVNLPLPTNPPGRPSTWDVFTDNHGHGRDIVWAGEGFFGGGIHTHASAQEAWDLYDGHAAHMAGGARGTSFADLTAQQFRGRGGAGQAGSPTPSLDNGQLRELVDYMKRADQYTRGPQTVAQRPDQPFEANVWGGDRVALEAMAPVMRGEIPIFFRADSEWQIRHIFLIADEFPDIRPVIVGGVHAFRVAAELATRQVPVILTRTRSPTPDRDDSYAASFRNATILHEAGVAISFGTDESADVRNLPEHVAVAVSHGLPAQVGLEAVTIRAAEMLGLADRMGSLEPGKRADILVTDGNPLQALTTIETMFIGGIQVDPRDNDHDRAYERFRQRR
jgi:imidazolonepropionase-like amidohydrolase